MSFRSAGLAALAFLAVFAVEPAAPAPLDTEGRVFVDSDGRQVLLNAINIGFTHRTEPGENGRNWAWEHGGPEDFSRIKCWGFNAVRLVLFWACVEPAPGQYDAAFLDAVEERLDWAANRDLFVVLDMHQDLWGAGVPGGRGAPAWALLAPDAAHVAEGPVWSAAYFQSPRVQKAFDAFWENRPGPDGAGIQDRFAQAWRHVAARFQGHPALIGYDLYNEPFAGSPVVQAMKRMTAALAPELHEQGVDLAGLEPAEAAKAAFEVARSDPGRYRKWLAAGKRVLGALDRRRIAPMYQRVAQSIREVDNESILFFAPALTSNLGVTPSLPPITRANGEMDPRQAFAPHLYEDDVARMRIAAENLLGYAAELGVPVFAAEWGNLGNEDKIFSQDPVPAAEALLAMLDEHLAGRAYWYYQRGLPNEQFFDKVLARPCPLAIAGRIQEYRFTPEKGELVCIWEPLANPKPQSCLYLPQSRFSHEYRLHMAPPITGVHTRSPVPQLPNWYLMVPSAGAEGVQKLRVMGTR